jgi:hypothetical protein
MYTLKRLKYWSSVPGTVQIIIAIHSSLFCCVLDQQEKAFATKIVKQ